MVYSFTSLAAQSVGVLISLVAIIIMAIQFMTFRLRTSFFDPSYSYGGTEEITYQDAYQGEGSTPEV